MTSPLFLLYRPTFQINSNPASQSEQKRVALPSPLRKENKCEEGGDQTPATHAADMLSHGKLTIPLHQSYSVLFSLASSFPTLLPLRSLITTTTVNSSPPESGLRERVTEGEEAHTRSLQQIEPSKRQPARFDDGSAPNHLKTDALGAGQHQHTSPLGTGPVFQ